MTSPAPQDIDITRGDSWDALVRVKGRDGSGNLVYMDLTGTTPKAQIRATADDPAVIAEITCTITDQVATLGGIYLRLEDTVTSALAPTTSAVWDLEVKWPDPNGDRKTILSGGVTITRDVTHA